MIAGQSFGDAAERVALVGFGNIGCTWALKFAANGVAVRVYEPDAGARRVGLERVAARGLQLKQAGLIQPDLSFTEQIGFATELEAAVEGASYVQESIVEERSAKRELFNTLEPMVDANAIFASSTSEIPGSELFAQVKHPERCLVVHPVNPPHLVPFVELVATPATSAMTLKRTEVLMRAIGQRPARLAQEVSGFVLNRLQYALLAEALNLVKSGVCGPEDVDAAVKHGLGLRWAFLGPFETFYLNTSGDFTEAATTYGTALGNIVASLNPRWDWDEDTIQRLNAYARQQFPNGVEAGKAARDTMILHLLRCLREAG